MHSRHFPADNDFSIWEENPFSAIGDAAYRKIVEGWPRRTEPRTQATCTKIGKDCACGSGDILADRQTDRQKDILITILRNRKYFSELAPHQCQSRFLAWLKYSETITESTTACNNGGKTAGMDIV